MQSSQGPQPIVNLINEGKVSHQNSLGTLNGGTFIQPQMTLSINNYNFPAQVSAAQSNQAYNHSILEEAPSEQYEEIVFENDYQRHHHPPVMTTTHTAHQRYNSVLTAQEGHHRMNSFGEHVTHHHGKSVSIYSQPNQ